MASVVSKGKSFRVFFRHGGERKSIYLNRAYGKVQAMVIGEHIDAMVFASEAKTRLPSETAEWAAGASSQLLQKIKDRGVAIPVELITVSELCDRYREHQVNSERLAPSTICNIDCAIRPLKSLLGSKLVADVTLEDIIKVRDHLSEGRAETTWTKNMSRVSGIFRFAQQRRIIRDNPATGTFKRKNSNPARDRYILAEEVLELMKRARNRELSLTLALCRFGGLRGPSETYTLDMSRVDLSGGLMTIINQKTARYEGKETRQTPICSEMREAFEAYAPESGLVTPGYAGMSENAPSAALRSMFPGKRLPWPKPFVNMRASCVTDIHSAGYNTHDVCRWMGHSLATASTHYSRVVKDRAAKMAAGKLSRAGWRGAP